MCWRRHQEQLRLQHCEATNTPKPAMGVVPLLEQRDQGKTDPDEHSDEDSIQPTEITGTSISPDTPALSQYPLRDR